MATQQHLPQYEGREPSGLHVSFSGKDEDLGELLPMDEPLVLIVRGRVTASAFKTNAFGTLNLVQSFKVDDSLVADEAIAREAEQTIKRRADELSGQASIDDELDDELEGDDDA